MSRLLSVLALSFVVFAGAARAAGPSPGLVQGSTGVTTPTSGYRFVTLAGPATTTLAAVDKETGSIVRWRTLKGQWGIPMVAFDGTPDGLTRDGRTLFVANWIQPQNSPLRASSTFRIYDANILNRIGQFTLKGDFAFDALSPDARTLYLIQHLSTEDTLKYVVRAYDLRGHRLLPQLIADKRQQGWIMRGFPMKRLATPDGRWVYTLYRQDGGYPFVHALDAVNRRAVCIGIPWHGNQDPLGSARLALGGGKLTITAGARAYAIDTKTFRLSPAKAGGGGSFPVALVAGAAGGAAVLLALAALVWLRRRPDPAGLPA